MALIPLMRGSALVPEVRTGFTDAVRGYLTGRQAAQTRELTNQRLQDLSEDRAARAEDRALTRQYRQEAAKLGPDATIQDRLSLVTRFGPPGAALNAATTVERLKLAQAADRRAAATVAASTAKESRKRTGAIDFAVSHGLADNPEQAAALYDAGFMDEKFEASLKQPKPLTNIGKINRAIETGEITPEQGSFMKANELAGEEVTTKARNDARRADTSAKTITKELDKFEDLFDEEGFAGPTSLGAKRRYAITRRGIQLLLKELFNLGVLNGPDLALMDQMLLDPSSAEAAALAATGQLESTMKDNLNQVRTMIESIRKNAVAGIPGFEGATGEVQRRFRFNPVTGALE